MNGLVRWQVTSELAPDRCFLLRRLSLFSLLMSWECHGYSEQPATAGLLQVGEQRVYHLYDGPGTGASPAGDPLQNVGRDGGHRGGRFADSLHNRAVSIPQHVHLTGMDLARFVVVVLLSWH